MNCKRINKMIKNGEILQTTLMIQLLNPDESKQKIFSFLIEIKQLSRLAIPFWASKKHPRANRPA